jgi:hypothetical protein
MKEMYFNQARQPISAEAWRIAFDDFESRRIGFDELSVRGERVSVSTVWFGIDVGPSIGTHEVPLIFETMVSGGDHDGWQYSWTTRDEAVEGHAAIVEKVKSEVKESNGD